VLENSGRKHLSLFVGRAQRAPAIFAGEEATMATAKHHATTPRHPATKAPPAEQAAAGDAILAGSHPQGGAPPQTNPTTAPPATTTNGASPAPAASPAAASSPPAGKPATVAEALGGFTEEAIAKVDDVKLKASLEDARAFASGVAAVLLSTDQEDEHLQEQLAKVQITMDDAVGMAADGVTLLEEIADRDDKADAYHIAVSHVQDTHAAVRQHLSSYTRLLQGKLGAKSQDLVRFGVKPLVPGHRAATKAKTVPKGTPPAAPPPAAPSPAK
jgi:hypothetical protein